MRESLCSAMAQAVDLAGPSSVLLGGSAMLALRGLDIEPNDIDLMAAAEDRSRLELALSDNIVATDERGRGAGAASDWRLHLRVEGEPIEIMGGLAIERLGMRWNLPLRSDATVTVGEVSVRLAVAGPWVALYSVINPPRAALAAGLVGPQDLSEVPEALGIQWPPEARPPR